MHEAKPLVFGDFHGEDDPLRVLLREEYPGGQLEYLASYLKGLGAKRFILEPNYFDLDYLDEFASFYSRSSRGYLNICRRVHYFSDARVDRDMFHRTLADDEDAKHSLQQSYLGFSVLRPIDRPLGRTVLVWYPDKEQESRITEPSRLYHCHIAGLELSVRGLAWQQQDSAVASCATIGVWTMLHSSALGHRHAIPTTAQITQSANDAIKVGESTFPSIGLQLPQLLEAIKHQNMNPIKIDGNLSSADG